jgi:hypothetical protein
MTKIQEYWPGTLLLCKIQCPYMYLLVQTSLDHWLNLSFLEKNKFKNLLVWPSWYIWLFEVIIDKNDNKTNWNFYWHNWDDPNKSTRLHSFALSICPNNKKYLWRKSLFCHNRILEWCLCKLEEKINQI